jgi:hypothetical protein
VKANVSGHFGIERTKDRHHPTEVFLDLFLAAKYFQSNADLIRGSPVRWK